MSLTTWFPNLSSGNYRITSNPDGGYNCVAWAAGESTRWWQPNAAYYWPLASIPDDEEPSVDHVVALFAHMGFETCPINDARGGYDRVAIYGERDRFTHAARQLDSGWWASKIGPDEDIEHKTLNVLEGDFYGEAKKVMRRSKLWASQNASQPT